MIIRNREGETYISILVETGYLSGNPLGLMRRKINQRASNQTKVIERFLEQSLWQFLVAYIEERPQTTPREKKDYERTRFLFYFLYLMGPRVSEIAQAKMQSVKQIRRKWW